MTKRTKYTLSVKEMTALSVVGDILSELWNTVNENPSVGFTNVITGEFVEINSEDLNRMMNFVDVFVDGDVVETVE